VVPYPAGGSTDVVARLIGQKLSEAMGQPFVIDNRAGASGIIGMEAVARAEPDGYTLLLNTAGAQTLTPVLYKTSVHPSDSWEPVGMISAVPFVIVATDRLPVKDFADLVKLAQKGEPPITASSGSSMITLVTDELKRTIKAPTMINVPYKGTAPQAVAVLSGEVDISVDSFVTMPHIEAGKLKPLAVTSAERVPSLPNVPTMKELGYDGMVFSSWSALLAPKGTPKPVLDRLEQALRKAVQDPEVQERLKGFHHTPVLTTRDEFAKVLVDDHAKWQRIVTETGYKVE